MIYSLNEIIQKRKIRINKMLKNIDKMVIWSFCIWFYFYGFNIQRHQTKTTASLFYSNALNMFINWRLVDEETGKNP